MDEIHARLECLRLAANYSHPDKILETAHTWSRFVVEPTSEEVDDIEWRNIPMSALS